MSDNEFFVVDLVSCKLTGEIINSLSLALETLKHTGKKIVLKLSNIYLNQSQLLSIQSLITSYGCTLDTVETCSEETASVARNMNISVKKVDEAVQIENPTFKPFDNKELENSSMIALKDVNGLHFEADLDAIKKQQEKIDITSDLREAGISKSQDFKDIEKQFAPDFAKFTSPVSQSENLDFNVPSSIAIDEPVMHNTLVEEKQTEQLNNFNKNSIGIYKKAYDENEIPEDHWEEVDFYETPTSDPVVSDTKETMYINQTLRSGQILEAEGNVVIIGDCHPGSEIKAVGDITVWGVLSGIAHAGCKGNINAKVRALKMNAVQLRIASCYSRRPDGTNIPYIIRSSIFTPEEARAVDGEIMLFKINQ